VTHNHLISPQPQLSHHTHFDFEPQNQQVYMQTKSQDSQQELPFDFQLQTQELKQQATQTLENLSAIQTQVQKQENFQGQISQRMDIFEEEIIKRVRDIQKFSKGINQVIRKSVIPDIQALKKGNIQNPSQQEGPLSP